MCPRGPHEPIVSVRPSMDHIFVRYKNRAKLLGKDGNIEYGNIKKKNSNIENNIENGNIENNTSIPVMLLGT
jgi:hypothetical protein